MRPALAPLALVVVLAPACAIEPQSGTWNFKNRQVVTNTCNVDIADGDFELDNNDDGTFTVDPNDGGERFDCTLEKDDAFSCPDRLQTTITAPGVDAVIAFNVRVSGTFESETEAEGTQRGVGVCAGSACDLAALLLGVTFPCETVATFDATYAE